MVYTRWSTRHMCSHHTSLTCTLVADLWTPVRCDMCYVVKCFLVALQQHHHRHHPPLPPLLSMHCCHRRNILPRTGSHRECSHRVTPSSNICCGCVLERCRAQLTYLSMTVPRGTLVQLAMLSQKRWWFIACVSGMSQPVAHEGCVIIAV